MAKTKKRGNAKVAAKPKSKAKANKSWFSRFGSVIKGRPKTALLVIVLVIVLLVAMVPKVQQSFASGCSGNKIDVYSIRKPSGSYAGYLNLYWNGKQNCAIAYAGGITSGIRMYRQVCIRADRETKRCDDGNYISYAGPVYTGYAVGDCVDLFAYFENNGKVQGYLEEYNEHCR